MNRTRDLIVTANADLGGSLEEKERVQEQLGQSQKMDSIGMLAVGLVHDFNNLLNVIRGYASVIMEHPDDRPGLSSMAKSSLGRWTRAQRWRGSY